MVNLLMFLLVMDYSEFPFKYSFQCELNVFGLCPQKLAVRLPVVLLYYSWLGHRAYTAQHVKSHHNHCLLLTNPISKREEKKSAHSMLSWQKSSQQNQQCAFVMVPDIALGLVDASRCLPSPWKPCTIGAGLGPNWSFNRHTKEAKLSKQHFWKKSLFALWWRNVHYPECCWANGRVCTWISFNY